MRLPIPEDDEARLAALHALEILDTGTEEGYSAIVRMASLICGTPLSNIALIDRERQWVKASVGGEQFETRRDAAFCAHTILQDARLVVTDARDDGRFRDNPFVVGAPYVRFYAGKRLVTPDGHAVGALCVVDVEPRELTDAQLEALDALASQASALLELRLRVRELEVEVRQRRNAEAAANIARRMAEEAQGEAELATRAKSEFLSRMSHELRTPLNAIIGFSRVLRKGKGGTHTPEGIQYLDRISANGHHLLQLVNGVLDLAKVESGSEEINYGLVDVAGLVRETVDALQGRVLSASGPGAVALVAEGPLALHAIESDALHLKQILINLVGNALKFTERGQVTVRVVADPAGVPSAIDVIDTGIGIPADRLEGIFNAFEQADRETGFRYGGTGLGLAISRTLAQRLGHSIAVSSVLGEGSTFSLRFRG
jgi:signal transduction histidine kinase